MRRNNFVKVIAALLTTVIVMTEFDYSVLASDLSNYIAKESCDEVQSSVELSNASLETIETNTVQDNEDTIQDGSNAGEEEAQTGEEEAQTDEQISEASYKNETTSEATLESDDANIATKEEIHQKIIDLPAYYAAEKEGVSISSSSEKLSVNESISLSLVDDSGHKIDNVRWFCRVIYPNDILATAEETKSNASSIFPCTLSEDGTVTGVTQKESAEIWAYYEGYLYRCLIYVNSYADDRSKQVDEKVQEIAQSVSHLSDVDKLMAVHDYLVKNVTYDLHYTHGGISSALLDKRAVCKGYAQAFSRIVNNLNIPCETVVGYSGDACHEWNKVQLDGKWYFVDVTHDDKDNDKLISYKCFLMGKDTFIESPSSYNRFDREDNLGNDYKYYAYKKMGFYADNQEELKSVLRKQFDSTDSSSVTVYAVIPENMDNWAVESAIKEVLTDTVSISRNDIERGALGGGYVLDSYIVSNIVDEQNKDNVSYISLKQKDKIKGEPTGFIVTLDKDVANLSASDISVNGLDVKDVISKGNGIYEITVNNILLKNNDEVTLQICKRNVVFSPNKQTINFRLDKEETPNASFEAIDGWSGLLKGCEVGMKYAIGNGEWKTVQSSEPIPITLDYRYQVRVIRQSLDASAVESDIQYLNMKKPSEPSLCKTESCTGSQANGKLIYVTKEMEYRKTGGEKFIPCMGTEVTGLEAGSYELRYAARGMNLASDIVTVSIEKSIKLPPYSITYELDGGTNNSRNPKEYLGNINVTLLSPTKSGYLFSGWFIGDKKITTLTPSSIDSDIVITAKWKENTYSLTLQGNGGKGKAVSKVLAYSEEYSLSESLFSRDGYTLIGWSTTATGNGINYKADDTVSKLKSANNGKITLYAKWKIIDYSITYDLDGAVNSLKNPNKYNILKGVTLDAPVKPGYVFLGFYDAKEDGVKITVIGKQDKKDYTLYARFSPISYLIRFNANSTAAKGSMEDLVFVGAEQKSLTPVGYTRDGYKFKGWNTRSNGKGTSYSDNELVSQLSETNGAKLTLYAMWEADHRGNIVYNGLEDADNSANPSFYTALTDVILKSPVRKGYTFLGFYGTDDLSDKNKVTVIRKTETGDRNLFARWKENSYRVVYNANGGVLIKGKTSPSIKKYSYSDEVTIEGELYSRAGYKFVGYNTSARGTGYKYSDSSTQSKLSGVNNGTVILYAQWEKTEYYLSYSASADNVVNASSLPKRTKHLYSDEIELPGDNLKRKGYRFKGWLLKTKGTSRTYEPSEKATFSIADGSNIVLYAMWEQEQSYAINYVLFDGVNNANNPAKYGSAYNVTLKNPTKTGYTFYGWYSEPEYKTKISVIKRTQKGDITLYAKWVMNSYNIYYMGNLGKATGAVPKVQKVNYTDEYMLSPCVYKRPGYRFVGWSYNAQGKGNIMQPGTKISKATPYNRRNVYIYAVWKKDGEK